MPTIDEIFAVLQAALAQKQADDEQKEFAHNCRIAEQETQTAA